MTQDHKKKYPGSSAWSAPFSDWVVEGWIAHSQLLDGPAVAARMKVSLADPVGARTRAEAAARKHNTKGDPK